MKKWVHAAVNPWKTPYEVHWISPDGKDCLLGGSKSVDGANKIARDQAQSIFESPWETIERKWHFLENLYVVDVKTEEDVMDIDTEEYIDNLMSDLHSRKSVQKKDGVKSATQIKTYRNKKNPNKYVEVHEDGYGHRSSKQYMKWDSTGVTNPTGDGNLHRWKKGNMNDLLEDYEEVKSSEYYEDADIYVVKIWYEVDPGRDAIGPQAAEEVITTVAKSPDEAIEQAKRQWDGPIDRIEIIDVNPDDAQEDLPYASTCVKGSEENWDDPRDYFEEDYDEYEFSGPTAQEVRDEFLSWYDSLPKETQYKVDDLADEMGLPLYEECTESQLSTLQNSISS